MLALNGLWAYTYTNTSRKLTLVLLDLFFSFFLRSLSHSLRFFAMIPALFTHHYYINFRILLFTLMNLFKFHEIFNSYLLVLFIYSLLLFSLCSCECVFLFFSFGILFIWYLSMWVLAQRTRTHKYVIVLNGGFLRVCYAISRKQSSRNCTWLNYVDVCLIFRCVSFVLRRRIKRRVTNLIRQNLHYMYVYLSDLFMFMIGQIVVYLTDLSTTFLTLATL